MKLLFSNKKFNINYTSVETYECGISLAGVEVKSIVKANANIDEAFALIKNEQIYLYNMYVAPWANAVRDQTEPSRKRKLLLHKHEIQKIEYTMKKQQLNLIPIKVYTTKNTIKVELSLAKHNKSHDKRRILKTRDDDRLSRKY